MNKNDVKLLEIAKKLAGLQTVSTISKKLNVKRRTAIDYAYKLKKLAEKYKIGRNVGALYDVARKCIKVRRMDERTRNALLKSNGKKFLFDYKIKSKSFQDVEKKWRVFIPLNKQDMEIYEEWSR